MKIKKRIFWLIIAVILYSAWVVIPVSAHAGLIRSKPEANAVLDQSPAQVELLFSEPLEANISTIKVIDSSGAVVDNGDASVDPSNSERMTISLPPLPNGIYTVSWAVISQIDGHQTGGSFPFAVGKVSLSAMPEEQSSGANMPNSALLAKWLLLASAAILAGQYPSRYFIWKFTLGSSSETFIRQNEAWDVLYKLGLYGILPAFVLGILSQAGQTTGHELAFPWAKETLQILTGTRLGVMWLLRLLLALLGLLVIRIPSIKWRGVGNFIVGLALLMTISLTSHSATELHPLLPVLADWLHLIGMSFWFGGLAHLIIGLVILGNAGGELRTIIAYSAARHFSTMALPSVAVIGLTGIYSAYLRVGNISALIDTVYGHSLLFKQGFVVALLLIAAINLLIISPGLERDGLLVITTSKYFQHFAKTVIAEIVLACLLLINVSVMTYLPPAVTPYPQTTLSGKSSISDLKFALFISPGEVGQNTFEVRLSPKRSAQVVETVTLTFVSVTADLPPSEIQLTETGNGIYTAQGGNVGIPGRWLVEITVQRQDQFDVGVSFDFTVAGPDSTNQSEETIVPLISKILMALIFLLIGVVFYPGAWKQ